MIGLFLNQVKTMNEYLFIYSLLGSTFAATFWFKTSIALLTRLFISQSLLGHLFLFISSRLWVIFLNNDTVLKLLRFEIV